MIGEALSRGPCIGGLATFEPTVPSLTSELEAAAQARGLSPEIDIRHIPGALDALEDGRRPEHDGLIAVAADDKTDVDVL